MGDEVSFNKVYGQIFVNVYRVQNLCSKKDFPHLSASIAVEKQEVFTPSSTVLEPSDIKKDSSSERVDEKQSNSDKENESEHQEEDDKLFSESFSVSVWNQGGFFFDITKSTSIIDVSIFGIPPNNSNRETQILGVLCIPVSDLYHGLPIDNFFDLYTSQTVNPNQNINTSRNNPTNSRTSIRNTFHFLRSNTPSTQNSNGQEETQIPQPNYTPPRVFVKLQYTRVQRSVGPNDFELLRVVGRGNFGKVMQVKKKDTGRLYAMKVIRKDRLLKSSAVANIRRERKVLEQMDHAFIVSLKYSFQTAEKLYLIMDYIPGGELFYHLSNVACFSEERSRFYAAEITLALGYLHERGIIYRDLKPENLLLDMSGHICLTDFGLVKDGIGYGDRTNTFCGSAEYLAPEILEGKGYGKEVDWWALGTLVYEMITGLPPFFDDNVAEMNKKIKTGELYFDPDKFNPTLRSFLLALLTRNPSKRLGSSIRGAEDVKRHGWFKRINWVDLADKKYEPPFKPHLKHVQDVRYFDPEFTSQEPRDSFIEIKNDNQDDKLGIEDPFAGFTFVDTSYLEKNKGSRLTQQLNIVPENNNNNDNYTDDNNNNNSKTKVNETNLNEAFDATDFILSDETSNTPPPQTTDNNNNHLHTIEQSQNTSQQHTLNIPTNEHHSDSEGEAFIRISSDDELDTSRDSSAWSSKVSEPDSRSERESMSNWTSTNEDQQIDWYAIMSSGVNENEKN